MLKRLLLSFFGLAAGLGLGLLLLEAILQVNPALLLRGMALPAPVDPPLTTQSYTVRYSDADLFYWHAHLIRPVVPEHDRLEAEVTFHTDEFGFANAAPLPARAEVVVLGRSFSLGLQAEAPWPRLLAEQLGQPVLNLAQAASGPDLKRDYYRRFGRPRHPRWVIVEVLPSMDILGYTPGQAFLVPQLPIPLLRSALDRWRPAASSPAPAYIYPLPVTLPNGEVELTFFSQYLAALTLDAEALAGSQNWRAFERSLLALVAEARDQRACVVLLYAPTKEEVYLSLAAEPEDLAPVLRAGWLGWRRLPSGWLAQDVPPPARASVLAERASVARTLLAQFAVEQGLALVDPTPAMLAAARTGARPFMAYDSHWTAVGHALVAELVAQALETTNCP